MKFLSSLDAKDRKIVVWCLGIAVCLAVMIGFLMPDPNANSNPLPSTYLAGQHGARAAYESLLNAGYPIERWERPLSELVPHAGPDTVVIFAQPFTRELEDSKAVKQILEKGGRVLATGMGGGYILPGGQPVPPENFSFAACELDPEGLDPLAGSGKIWMIPQASWQLGNPAFRVQYSCVNQPAVVEYDWGKGHIVWWASSTPLENGSLDRAQNFDLLLNSIGPREKKHFYWDESLHGDVRSVWSYAAGPAQTILWFGLLALAILVIFSFSRRSGPLRDEPAFVRTAPLEFIEALGTLYRKARASNTAAAVAYESFRRRMLRLCGLRNQPIGSAELASALRRRFPQADTSLEADLAAAEEAHANDSLEPRVALRLIQTLHDHQNKLLALARSGAVDASSSPSSTQPQEKAS